MNLGKMLIAAGLALVVLGALVVALSKSNLPLGRLPGDLTWRGKSTTLYFPVVTCLLLSLLGSLLLWLFNRNR